MSGAWGREGVWASRRWGAGKAAHRSPRTLCPDPLRIGVQQRQCWLKTFICILCSQWDATGQGDSSLPRDTTHLSLAAGTGRRELQSQSVWFSPCSRLEIAQFSK